MLNDSSFPSTFWRHHYDLYQAKREAKDLLITQPFALFQLLIKGQPILKDEKAEYTSDTCQSFKDVIVGLL